MFNWFGILLDDQIIVGSDSFPQTGLIGQDALVDQVQQLVESGFALLGTVAVDR